MKSNAERQETHRQAMKKAGFKQLTLWVPASQAPELKRLAAAMVAAKRDRQ